MKLQPLHFDRRKVLKIWFVCQYYLLWPLLKNGNTRCYIWCLKAKRSLNLKTFYIFWSFCHIYLKHEMSHSLN